MAEQVSSLKTGIKYKNTPIGKIPVDWEVVKLGDICEEIYRYPTYYNIKYVEQDGIPEVRGELIKNNGELSSDPSEYRYISKETSANFPRTILHEGDFVLSVRGTMGKIGYIPDRLENANMTANLMRISPDRIKVYPLWLKQFFLSDFFQKPLEEASSATTIKTIKAPELKAIELPLPLLSEQKKMAEILTTVDETIEKTDQIIEKTKEVKKGLMQKLLTRGIGHKEFKKTEIGEIPIEWEVVKLGTLTETITKGTTPTTYGFNFTESGINFVKVENVDENGNFILENITHISEEANKALNRSILRESDILFSIAGALGRVAIVNKDLLPANTNQALAIIRLKKNIDTVVEYVKYYLLGPIIQGYIRKIAVQSAQANLSLEQVNNFLLSLPTTLEQEQITEILSSVDEEIEIESDHKEGLENLKKGLMQVLLTGKIRVSV